MPCPACGSKKTKEQKYQETETEEIPGVFIKQLIILCHDCKWGFNCMATLDTRPKKS